MPTTTDENKAIYANYIQKLFNEGRFDLLDDLVTPDYKLNDPPPGKAGDVETLRQVVAMNRESFPDLNLSLDGMIAEADMVAARSTMTGTHQGEFFGVPATGKPIKVGGMTMVRIKDGRIAESWVKNDVMGIMKQIGALPPEK